MNNGTHSSDRIYASQSSGWFGQIIQRSDDGSHSWKPITRSLKSLYELPGPEAEVGHCVHRMALHPSRPDVLFMQKHWDVMRSDNAGEHWAEVSGNLPTDFGFPIEVHSHQPETIYVVPITSDSLLTMVCACALRGACFVVTPSMQPVAATCPTRRCRSVE